MTRALDLAVAGAGIMGLACALEAARRGKRVGVFDPAGTGTKASFAAAGILVTRDAHAFASPFREFYVRSIRQYPEWLAGITALTGSEIPLHRGGDSLIFDLDDPEAASRLESKRRQFDRERAVDYSETDTLPDFLLDHCPLRNVKVFRFPSEAYVQNRDLLEALRSACEKAGVAFLARIPRNALAPCGRIHAPGFFRRILGSASDADRGGCVERVPARRDGHPFPHDRGERPAAPHPALPRIGKHGAFQ